MRNCFWAHARGLSAEGRAEEFILSMGVRVVARRVRVAGVELDLLGVSSLGAWIVVEVKSLGDGEWVENRLSWRQRARLVRAANALADGWRVQGVSVRSSDVELWLIFVPRDGGQVQMIQDFA